MKKKPLEIDMIAGSQLRDTQGEMLCVEGADISELEAGRGRLNDNHGTGFYNSIGRVTFAKKVFNSDDCDDERQKYYWEKVKSPFLYVRGILYEDDHPNAKAAAAILRNIHKTDCPLQLKASVEGGVVARGIKDPQLLARTKIHSVALTFTPANQATLVEPINLDKSADIEADMQLIKSVMHLAKTNVPSFRHITRRASAERIADNLAQAKELASQLGLKTQLPDVDPKDLIKEAVLHKIAENIEKINELTKLVVEEGDLAKASKKQIAQMLGDTDKDGKVAKWISEKLPRDDMATWFAREYRKDPSIFNDRNKTDLEHHASIAKTFDSSFRLDKTHDFQNGMDALKKDGDELSKKHAEKNKFVEPEGEKFLDLGNGKAWYSLGKGACSKEAKAMGHCGNVPSQKDGDNILSLRQEVKTPDGKIVHKPLITAIENGGYLGETKGPANTKPTDKKAMAALLKDPRIKGNIGGGYADNLNFHLEDLDPEDQEELKHKHTTFMHSMDEVPDELMENSRFGDMAQDHNNAIRAIKALQNGSSPETMPESLKREVIKHPAAPKNFVDHMFNHEDQYLRRRAIKSPHFTEERANQVLEGDDDDAIMEALHKPFITSQHREKALDHPSGAVRMMALKSAPELTPEMVNKAVKDSHSGVRSQVAASHHISDDDFDKLVEDKDDSVRAALLQSPKLQAHHFDKLINDPSSFVVHQAMQSQHLKPEHLDSLVNHDSWKIRAAVMSNPHLKPEHVEKLMNDNHDSVKEAFIRSNHFKAEHIDRFIKDPSPNIHRQLSWHKHLTPDHIKTALETVDHPISLSNYLNSKHFLPEHVEAALKTGYGGIIHDVSRAYPDHPAVKAYNETQQQQKIKKSLQEKFTKINHLTKALTAGYGGAGAPTSMTGGSVLQAEQLDDGRKGFKYITCQKCGHEQVLMPHQVRCRGKECGQNFSFENLFRTLQ